MTTALALALLLAASGARPEPPVRRYALVVGENRGDPADAPLRFAEQDARRFFAVMEELGYIEPQRARVLLGASAADLEQAAEGLRETLAREGTQSDQLFVYVSSHASAGELHLRGGRYPIRELVELVKKAPVGVAVLVVDTCESGQAIRLKGLRPVSGTVVSAEVPEVTGRVIITSSGPAEYAQEADSVNGSYFSHHLVVGLRGAADTSGDGRVSLQEAYRYAYARTVESTFSSRAGVQHPSYELDLAGKGDVIFTWPSIGSGRIRFDVEGADFLVLSSRSDELLGQLSDVKAGTALAVTPGEYRIRMRSASGLRQATVAVPPGAEVPVSLERMAEGELVAAAFKGASSTLELGVGASGGTGIVGGVLPMLGGGLWLCARGAWGPLQFAGASASFSVGGASGPVPFRQTESALIAEGGRTLRWSSIYLDYGAELGAALVRQSQLPDEQPRLGVEPLIGVMARLSAANLRLTPYLAGSGGLSVVRRIEGRSVRGYGSCDLGVALRF